MEIVKSMAKLVILKNSESILEAQSFMSIQLYNPSQLVPPMACLSKALLPLGGWPGHAGGGTPKSEADILRDIQSRSNKIPNKNKIITLDESSSLIAVKFGGGESWQKPKLMGKNA